APIERPYVHFDGERLILRTSPRNGDDACRLRRLQALEVAAIHAVDAHATPERDVPGDRLGRNGTAAACEMRQEIADTLDRHASRILRHRCGTTRDGRGQLLRFGATLNRTGDLRDVDVALADRKIKLVGALQVELADELRKRHGMNCEPLQFAFEDLLSLRAILFFVELAEPGANLAAVTRRYEIAERGHEPVAAGVQLFAGDDLDLIAVLQRLVERHHAPVDLGAAAAVAEIRMQMICVVERRRAARQIDDLAARRQRVDSVFEQLGAHAFEKIAFALEVALARLEDVPQPHDLLLVGRRRASAFLVLPMGRDAELRMLVHLVRADLNLERQLARTDHGRVERSI